MVIDGVNSIESSDKIIQENPMFQIYFISLEIRPVQKILQFTEWQINSLSREEMNFSSSEIDLSDQTW